MSKVQVGGDHYTEAFQRFGEYCSTKEIEAFTEVAWSLG